MENSEQPLKRIPFSKKELSQIKQLKNWMLAMTLVYFIIGAVFLLGAIINFYTFFSLGLISTVIALIPIFLGFFLIKSSHDFKIVVKTDIADQLNLVKAFVELKKFFMMQVILFLTAAALVVIWFFMMKSYKLM